MQIFKRIKQIWKSQKAADLRGLTWEQSGENHYRFI